MLLDRVNLGVTEQDSVSVVEVYQLKESLQPVTKITRSNDTSPYLTKIGTGKSLAAIWLVNFRPPIWIAVEYAVLMVGCNLSAHFYEVVVLKLHLHLVYVFVNPLHVAGNIAYAAINTV